MKQRINNFRIDDIEDIIPSTYGKEQITSFQENVRLKDGGCRNKSSIRRWVQSDGKIDIFQGKNSHGVESNPEGIVYHCNSCKRNVYFVQSKAELDYHRLKGNCIAFKPFRGAATGETPVPSDGNGQSVKKSSPCRDINDKNTTALGGLRSSGSGKLPRNEEIKDQPNGSKGMAIIIFCLACKEC